MNASWNALINSYKVSARTRGIVWDLTSADAIELFKRNCEYCGVSPNQEFNPYIGGRAEDRYSRETIARSWILYNGIDRLDNHRGYYLMNCVSCCGRCNRAKKDSTVEEFESWIENLARHYIKNKSW